MLTSQQKVTFATTPDFELGFEHGSRQTDYFISLPENKAQSQLQGLVVYIPGFGDDAGDYRHVFCKKVAEQFGLAALTVDYHCFYSRPKNPESTVYEPEDIALIEKLFLTFKLPFSGNTVEEGLDFLNAYLVKSKQAAQITATLLPGKNEYQNGGVMQALDIINAVGHALQTQNISADNVILVGSSYGGYIANLASKFAPKTFRAVFDNSSWANPHFGYIVGREKGFAEFTSCRHSHIQTYFFLRSAWTLNKGLPNTFDGKRFHVRAFSQAQIAQFALYQPDTYYYFIHAENDEVAITEDKVQMARQMIAHNLPVQMEVIEAADVDGRYIKTIGHGMDLSMLTFFERAYTHIQTHQISLENDFNQQSVVRYDSAECCYQFDFSSLPVKGQVICFNMTNPTEQLQA